MFKNITFQVLKPHLIALAIFIALPLAYLSPALSGKILRQDDIIQGESKSYEIVNFRRVFLIYFLIICSTTINCDLPVHCKREQIEGEWTFRINKDKFNQKIT